MPESRLPIPWQLVASRLPAFLKSTNDPNHGIIVRPKESALEYSHIQLDASGFRSVLLFDVDDSLCGYTWDDKLLPEPSWIAVNPKNGHSHIAYVLHHPVVRLDEKHAKPVQFLNVVKRGIQLQLGADPAYNGALTKNPMSSQWQTRFSDRAYTLSELYEWIRPDVLKLANSSVLGHDETHQQGLIAAALGRNDYVFNATRRDAYSNWDTLARLDTKLQLAWLEENAAAHNLAHGGTLLASSEIRQTAKSVSKFISSAYDPTKGRQGLPQRQRHRQKIKAERQRRSTEARIGLYVLIAVCMRVKVTVSAIARQARISREALYRYHPWAVRQIHEHNSQLVNVHKDQQLRVFDSYFNTALLNYPNTALNIHELVIIAGSWPKEGRMDSTSEWLNSRCIMPHNWCARPRLGRTI